MWNAEVILNYHDSKLSQYSSKDHFPALSLNQVHAIQLVFESFEALSLKGQTSLN